MKKLPILLLSGALLFGVAACGGNGGGNTGSSQTSTSQGGGSSSQKTDVTVDSVKISGYTDTTVFDGTSVTLKATVTGSTSGLKVSWTTSDDKVATVVNGVVKFKTVSEDKKVTITATSKDDATKSDSVEFTVKHFLFDVAASKGNPDISLFATEGTILTDVGDVALPFADVYGTKWYVEASMNITELNESDAYPKFGIMTGTDEGNWNNTTETQTVKNAFFYCDSMTGNKNSGWSNFNFVTQNDTHVDWNWGGQKGGFAVAASDKAQMQSGYKMGLLRDGCEYYLYAMKDGAISAYKHVTYTDIAADEPSYAWLGGWSIGMEVSEPKVLIGDEVNALYQEPTELNVSTEEETLYLGDTFQLATELDAMVYNPTKLTYTSSNPEIATVSSTGLVTAGQAVGSATIAVQYGSLSKEVKINVTDDAKFKVVLDGKMDDLLWSEAVKENVYQMKKNDDYYINFYASKNSKGVYVFADYYAKEVNGPADGWWQNDNFEIRLGNKTQLFEGDQIWASTKAGDHTNATGAFIEDMTLDAEKNMYHSNMEVFVSYNDTKVTREDDITIHFGSNPKGGWYACSWWMANDFAKALKVTENGLSQYVPADHYCTENHTWGEWVVTQEATCAADGVETRTCAYCGETETRAIPKGAHTYDLADVTVITPSTCTTHGTGTVECTTCHKTVTVELPLDEDNHNGHDFSTGPCACGETIDPAAPIVNDSKATSGGWDNRATWTDLGVNLEGDFTLKAKYHFNGNLGDPANFNVWQHPLLVVSDAATKGDDRAYGDNATFRIDWCAWMDDRDGDGAKLADSINAGAMFVDNFDSEMPTVIRGASVELTVKRSGNDVSIKYVIKSDSTGKVYNFEQGLAGVHTNKLDVSLSAEFATFNVTSAKVVA